jgi:hypothetical protein
MTSMSSYPAATSRRPLPRLAACLGVLMALFLMHGPGAEHMLARAEPMPSSTSATMPLMAHAPVADRATPAARNTPADTVAAMGMSPCQATLRDNRAQRSTPSALGLASTISGAMMPPTSLVTEDQAAGRAPPGPERSSLCVWRT